MPSTPRIILIALTLAAAYFGVGEAWLPQVVADAVVTHDAPLQGADARSDTIAEAFTRRQSDVQVLGTGVVAKVLSDDNKGSRHQRFILRMPSGQTVLIAHNIDLAPRIPGLRVGDEVTFFGEYEWNEKGGVVHWTHHDPKGRHVGGWLKHRGQTYE